MILLVGLLAPEAHAQACVCSRNVALPSGSVARPGEVATSLEYGVGLSGDTEGWRGFWVTDRYGDSMAGMFMPPHLVQTATAAGTVGLPAHFSTSVTVPFLSTTHVGKSGMPGDVDSRSIGDVELSGQWGWTSPRHDSFAGLSVGVSFPTGEVVPDSPVRSGRGAAGGSAGLQFGRTLGPKVAAIGAFSAGGGIGPDKTGYFVGPGGSLTLGTRFSFRENGKFNLATFGVLRAQAEDWQDALMYKNTGFFGADVAVAAGYTFWERELRSAAVNAKVVAPVWQDVGDPMYAQNVAVSVGVGAVLF